MFRERELYEKLKEYYDILGVDENVDEVKLKRAYRIAAKRYHPDGRPGDTDAEENFKKASEAYTVLKEENNRKLYSELKRRYERESSNTTKKERKSSFHRSYEKREEKEYTNRYIFQRRDGSKIEIQPLDRYSIEDQTVYRYRVNQYYKDMTIVDDVYGRINLEELLRTPEYCDFCVNNLLSRDNIYQSQVHYNGYIGHIEGAIRNGKRYYRIVDKDSPENFDISIDVGDIRYKSEREVTIDMENYDLWIEEIGKMMVKGKPLNQYFIFSDSIDIMNIIYSEDIDLRKVKNNSIYRKAISDRLVSETRLKQKIKDGGYVGQALYNVESDDYDIVVDKEIERVLNIRSNKEER